MIIEDFRGRDPKPVHDRFTARGRMLPEGLTYLNSWPEKDGDRCFQLMEANDPSLFKVWIDHWKDLVSFEVIEIRKR